MTHIMSNGSNEQSKQVCVVEVERKPTFPAGFVWLPRATITLQ